MQSVIKSLSSDGGLQRILQLVKADLRHQLPTTQQELFRSTVLPFFKVISHPRVLSSGLLENSIGTIYNALFGSNGQYSINLFRYVLCNADGLSMDELEPTMIVFSNVLDKNGTAPLLDGFKQIVDLLEAKIKSVKDDRRDLTSINTRRFLDRAKHRLGLGVPSIQPVTSSNKSVKPRARYEMVSDGPGELSKAGPRHDNDFADIQHIRILPTFQEILCDRAPYLPVLDTSQLHLPGSAGLLDRHFRLYREDVIGPVRDATRMELKRQNNPNGFLNPSHNGLRTNVYTNLAFEDLRCHDFQGIIVIGSVDQPSHLAESSERMREDWWISRKRLQKDSLVCILDPTGRVIFGTVTEIKESKAHVQEGNDVISEVEGGIPYQDFASNPHRAFLTILPAEEKDIPTVADYFSQRTKPPRNLTLLEFPKILLQAFQPTLAVIQEMSKAGDLPFADLLAPTAVASEAVDVGPPSYAQQRDFGFDLSCLLSNGRNLVLSPNASFNFNLGSLTENSTLDDKQAEALVHTLLRRLALCQGPPGTGKSYTGVALARVLLKNKERADLGPMLVVTYTNHALDQFLEHLLDGGIDRVIRMGSRSTCDRLGDLNLRIVSRNIDRTSDEKKEEYARRRVMITDAAYVTEALRKLKLSNTCDGLKDYLRENHTEHHDQLWGVDEDGFEMISYSSDYIIRTWLHGKPTNSRTQQAERTIDEILATRANVWEMPYNERRKLHAYWVDDCQTLCRQMFLSAVAGYRQSKTNHEDARREIELRCLQEANIIGLTTSGLARNMKLLRRLPIKAVIVEEAGEVLEAHILTALLPSVEHLVLIGDHFQLKPQVANYDLSSESSRGKKYSLDMSLFERLVSPPKEVLGIKLPLSILQTQRRMHPSISNLIRRTIYPHLENADNVSIYPEVIGMLKRLYWLDHNHLEAGAETNELVATSKSNDFEVDMCTELVGHLLKQGEYQSGEIAVITPYLGQLFKIKDELSQHYEIVLDDRDVEALEKAGITQNDQLLEPLKMSPQIKAFLKTVKLASVDNFQGEEAKVVIVSLVRSNKERKCGFLKTINRINVLLSRAKHGMYIIGNSATSAGVPMWSQVIDILKKNDNIGPSLALCCPRHPDTKIEVSTRDDFQLYAPEGGCNLKCDRRLKCGHACLQKCHSDLRHNSVRCLEPCPRTKRGCNHVCPKYCGDQCDRRCEMVLKDINLKLKCGHVVCHLRCWELQTHESLKCTVQVKRIVPCCGHTVDVACHIDVGSEEFRCFAPCGANLTCGHSCKLSCWSCQQQNTWRHGSCVQQCNRKYSNCSHMCQDACHPGEPCGLCKQPCEVACSHSRCDQECGQPCIPCAQEECSSRCPHSQCTMPCAAPCNWIPCSRRCSKTLNCGHQCPSLCGEACPDAEYCQICGHASIKSMVVDLLEFKLYQDVDVNDDPLIIPPCGHAKLMSSMDGNLGMSSAYDLNPDGTVNAIKEFEPFSIGNTSSPMAELKDLRGCPECRGSLRNINRYGRIVRRVILDEGTKRFVTSAGAGFGPLVERLYSAQKQLGESQEAQNKLDLPPVLTLKDHRNDQFLSICAATNGWGRYAEMRATRQAIANYFVKVHKDETPFARLWTLVEHAQRKNGRTSGIELQNPVSHMAFHIMALALLIRCDVVLLADVLNQLKKLSKGPMGLRLEVDLRKNREECTELINEALKSKDYERAVEGHIFYTRYCVIERSFATTPVANEAIQIEGQTHVTEAYRICETHGGKLSSLVSEVKDVERSLNGGTFIQPVSSEERRSVLAAMAKEFRGTGHWYRCANGHPFSIGECGMPMELARCPQCDARIGGREHRLTEGVDRAEDLDVEIAGMNLGG
ncbi:P-loop containing nucleoside triphosphate hydrolase protein [Lindgomyces ingoldianus]|uniref:P-loop containing nucleoside triphosphate hydrolase protein n=1 Tax=Lindgomyces ingoldianus TaxID=673940 RepID=A0ACB6QA60_9PLEO|nr:P-loop containing nucleoside triphosphate hydrolase protein [Lindgomyces ingoldianus]KAF2463801.1 P-loop containing nucleoside triphosphate hydrolase protein [Lindgomyces ingoldianus]